MHDEIERAPGLAHLLEHGVDGRRFADVAVPDHEAANFLGERLDAFAQRITLITESELPALGMHGLGDTPGDRAVVGEPHDQPALAAHETRGCRHENPWGRCSWLARNSALP